MIAVSMGYYDYFGLLRMRTRFRRVVIGHILHSDISDGVTQAGFSKMRFIGLHGKFGM